jgi:hypothetical protein
MANAAPTVRTMQADRSKASKCNKLEETTHRPTAAHRQARACRQTVKHLTGAFRIRNRMPLWNQRQQTLPAQGVPPPIAPYWATPCAPPKTCVFGETDRMVLSPVFSYSPIPVSVSLIRAWVSEKVNAQLVSVRPLG